MSLKGGLEILVPDQVQDKVTLSFIIVVETNIVFNSNFVEHV